MNRPIQDPGSSSKTDLAAPLVDRRDNPDGLLPALEFFCRFHGLSFSKERALRGVPLEGSKLPAGKLVRACENLGLMAKLVEIKPSSVSEMLYPCLVFFKNGLVGVIRSKTADKKLDIVVWDREGNRAERPVSPATCDRQALEAVCYVTRPPRNEAEAVAESGPHWFWPTVRRFWPNWTYVAIATFFVNLLGLALPLFVMNVYDRVIPNNSISTLWALVLGVTIALVFDLLLKVLRSRMIDDSGKRIDLSVSAGIFEHALDVKMKDRPGRSGELANRIREFESVREFFSSGAVTALIDLMFIGVFLLALWYIVGPLALVPLVAVPIVLTLAVMVQVPLRRTIANSQTASGSRHSVLVESLVSIETVKSISAEGTLQKRWENAVAAAARAGAATRFWSSLVIYTTMFAQQAVSVIVIAWGVFLVAAGEITIGALIAANIIAGRILAPLGGISGTLVRAQQSFSALANLNEVMRLERDNPKSAGSGASVNRGRVEFRNVEFSYPEQAAPALNQITLQISAGERVGIIGRVGSGKSTIGKLIGGLYHPSEGGVLVDGVDTRHFDSATLRHNALYVGQETELFSGTLRDNVLFGGPDRADALEPCLNASGVSAFASRSPLGLEMPVGERGRSLSGGQRQSVGIARAMLINPKVMFLDEPTAHMDTVTEAAFLRSFSSWLSPEMTLIVATHRNSLLELVDRLVVVEDGRVLIDGPKDRVLSALEKRALAAKQGKGGRNGG